MIHLREGGFLITLVNYQASTIFAEMLSKQGIQLKSGEGRVFFAIWSNDGISFGDLQKKILIPKSTLAETLDRLETAGYIKRIKPEIDRRKVLLRITEKMKVFRKTLNQISEDMTSLFYNGFDAEEIDMFEEFLKRILDNLS
jgi:DNA-binding MarR family transcriptional regulator